MALQVPSAKPTFRRACGCSPSQLTVIVCMRAAPFVPHLDALALPAKFGGPLRPAGKVFHEGGGAAADFAGHRRVEGAGAARAVAHLVPRAKQAGGRKTRNASSRHTRTDMHPLLK